MSSGCRTLRSVSGRAGEQLGWLLAALPDLDGDGLPEILASEARGGPRSERVALVVHSTGRWLR